MAASSDRTRVAAPPRRPLLIYDGDCGFCRLWIARWKEMTREAVDYAPSQEAAARFPDIPPEDFDRSVQLIEPDGSVFSGAEGVFRALAHGPRRGFPLWAYEHVPGAALVTEGAYEAVAGHRPFFSLLTRLVWGRSVEKPRYTISSGLFLRLVGIVYLAAFLSLWLQIDGLAGSDGILPAARFLDSVRSQTGGERYWFYPPLCWLDASDAFLNILCGGGAFLSVLVILGVAPAPCLFLLWLSYLSLTIVCREFLGFQWDNLLLETGFLAILAAPLGLRCGLALSREPPRLVQLLVRLLLFRLIFSSGVVKFASGDPNWRNFTALQYHYETQPIPNSLSWYMHQLPASFQKLSCTVTFFCELLVPLFVFAPRRLRYFAFAGIVGLQVLLELTGNYAFFNWLTIVLCVPLLDDSAWPGRWREKLAAGREVVRRPGSRGVGAAAAPRWPVWITAPLSIVIFIVGTVHLAGSFRKRIAWPRPVLALTSAISPLRSVNGYGLFMVMTTRRPEIIIEGSNDGKTWLPYEFKWKPGDLKRRPPWVAPHQPRLDWQMWFAALADYRSNPWFLDFLTRLLQGSPDVLALLERNPYPSSPPRYIRASIYDYRFTSWDERRPDGSWWLREYKGLYCPVVSLRRDPASPLGNR